MNKLIPILTLISVFAFSNCVKDPETAGTATNTINYNGATKEIIIATVTNYGQHWESPDSYEFGILLSDGYSTAIDFMLYSSQPNYLPEGKYTNDVS